MLQKFCLPPALLFAGLVNHASAQLVFVPDVNLRAYLDSVVPGVVDANGYIDSNGPLALGVTEIPINLTWTPLDLSGIEAFVNLEELHVVKEENGVATPLTISAFPPNLLQLEMSNDFFIASLPAFPASLERLWLAEFYGLSVLPPLPAGLTELVLIQMMDLTSVPPLPATMSLLSFSECPALATLPAFPSEVFLMGITSLPVTVLPDLPTLVTGELRLQGLGNLALLPAMPEKIYYELSLWGLPLIDTLNLMPDSCPSINLEQMPIGLEIGDWPADLQELTIGSGGPACISVLPPSLVSLICDYCMLECLSNIPPSLQWAYWNEVNLLPNEIPLCNLLSGGCPIAACGIGGLVFLDSDSDGVQDPGEPPYPNTVIQASPGNWLTTSGNDGSFVLGVPVDTYSINCGVAYPYVQSVLPTAHSAVFTQLTDADTLNDFAVSLMPNIQDLTVDLTVFPPPVPGFPSTTTITWLNYGTQIQDGTVSFTHDPSLAFLSSSLPPTNTNGNVLTWAFVQMLPGETRSVSIQLDTPTALPLGTSYTHTVSVDPLATDQTPGDNTAVATGTVVGSFDPNDKAVSPSALTPAQVAAGERVAYTVRFQNTGTWPATRVVVTDTLSADLQWNTMQLVAASHAHIWFINNGLLHVVFDNINLPDSNANEPESHGFFKFTMKPVNTLLLGDPVSNTANIYFDFNEPVITNAAVFSVDNNVGTPETAQPTLHLSPNPVSDVLAVEVSGSASNQALEVVDVTGRTVLRAMATGTRTLLDVHVLKAGSYQVRVGDGMVGRFVKR